jgi:hypothetical protein
MVASGVVQTIGVGLTSTFKVDTSSAKWIGYQVIAGFGRGLGAQMVRTSLPLSVLIIVSPRH